jgi:hypothetical protein
MSAELEITIGLLHAYCPKLMSEHNAQTSPRAKAEHSGCLLAYSYNYCLRTTVTMCQTTVMVGGVE